MKKFGEILAEAKGGVDHKAEARSWLAKAADHPQGSKSYHEAMAKHHEHKAASSIRSDEHSEKAKAHRAAAAGK